MTAPRKPRVPRDPKDKLTEEDVERMRLGMIAYHKNPSAYCKECFRPVGRCKHTRKNPSNRKE